MDPEYAEVVRDSRRKWRQAHPNYQKTYWQSHPEAATRNRQRQRQRNEKRRIGLLVKNTLVLDLKRSAAGVWLVGPLVGDLVKNTLVPSKLLILQNRPMATPSAATEACTIVSSHMERTIAFTLNGRPARVRVDDERMLLWVLRYDLGLTGTKFGCGEGQCGACTVIVDREPVRSCATPVKDMAGKRVITIEGLSPNGRLHPLQEAFLKHNAFQCGYCTPGMILNAYALLLKTPHPTREQILEHMENNLCRCGSHPRIMDAIQEAAEGAR